MIIDETTTTVGTPPTAPVVTQTESISVENHTPVTFTGRMKKSPSPKTEGESDLFPALIINLQLIFKF